MLRRVVKKKRFTFADARNWTRQDRVQFEWLVANGFFADAGEGYYTMTDRGRASAELGEFEWDAGSEVTPPRVKPKAAR